MNETVFHPLGEPKCTALMAANGPVAVDTFGGRVHVEWDAQAAITPLGQLPFFIEFLQVSGRFDPWVESCPLQLRSPNAPSTRDVLGTAMLSILAGHRRYAHISALRVCALQGDRTDGFQIQQVDDPVAKVGFTVVNGRIVDQGQQPVGIGGPGADQKTAFVLDDGTLDQQAARNGADATPHGKFLHVAVPGMNVENGGQSATVGSRYVAFH